MAVRRPTWELAGALAIVLAAVVIWYTVSATGVSTNPSAATPAAEPAPRSGPPVPPPTDEVTAATAEQRAREIIARIEANNDLAELPGRDHQAVLDAAHEQFAIYLGGAFERYRDVLRATEASSETLAAETTPARREELEILWTDAASVVARRPISVESAKARVRYLAGRAIPHEDLGRPTWVSAPARYELGGANSDAAQGLLTLVEFVVPVDYRSATDGISGPAWWGFWLVRHPGRAGRWVMWRSVIYDAEPIGVKVVPAF